MELVIEGFECGYGSVKVVDGISLSVAEGGALAILGRNGMGKTTLLNGMLGYLPDVSGSVRIGRREVLGSTASVIARRGVAYAGQTGAIFGDLTVQENLHAGQFLSHANSTHFRRRQQEIFGFFPILGERLRQRANTLSGGEQRMLALSRVLLSDPRVIVLDELSAGLQPAKVAEVETALRAERQHRKTTILMVEQNLTLATGIAAQVAVLKLGRIEMEAPADAPGIRQTLITHLAP